MTNLWYWGPLFSGLFCGVPFLLSLIEKFDGGLDIGTIFGRLIVNDGEIGSQSDVSISTASSNVVVPPMLRFTGARRDNLLARSLDLLASVVPFICVVNGWLLVTSATVVVTIRPPGSISV